jgi:hypothetical protein
VKTELTKTVKMVIDVRLDSRSFSARSSTGIGNTERPRTAVAQNVLRQPPPTALVESQLKRYRLAAVMLRK